jgi:hypothetical protein
LPRSVARALAQAEADDHPDAPWRPPASLPEPDALTLALAMLTPRPAEDATIAACLAALVIAFEPNTRLSAEATRLRFEVWKQANADLGDRLWRTATERAIGALKWMPKPAEFRDLVGPALEKRARERRRCEAMLAAHARQRNAPPPRPPATEAERTQELIDLYRKHNRPDDVARLQRRLDELLNRKAMP